LECSGSDETSRALAQRPQIGGTIMKENLVISAAEKNTVVVNQLSQVISLNVRQKISAAE